MHYKARRIRPLSLVPMLLRSIANLLALWPWLLVAAFVLSPVGPHIRTQYTYIERGSHRVMLECDYLGARGFVTYIIGSECPIVTIIDRRTR